MTPTVCRIVRYWPTTLDKASMVFDANREWMAAIVVGVHESGMLNLTVFDSWGNTHARQCVPFVVNEHGSLNGVCSWPPREEVKVEFKSDVLPGIADVVKQVVNDEMARYDAKLKAKVAELFNR